MILSIFLVFHRPVPDISSLFSVWLEAVVHEFSASAMMAGPYKRILIFAGASKRR